MTLKSPENPKMLMLISNSELCQGESDIIFKGKRPGAIQISGLTALEIERMEMLLEPNVRTYGEAATRLGISEDAMNKTMQRVMNRYSAAKAYSGTIERWKVKRRDARKGRYNTQPITFGSTPPSQTAPPPGGQ